MGEQVKILRTRLVAIDSVHAHPSNARRSDEERIRRSLEDHGQYAPIVVHDESKDVIVHNHVWRIAKELGLKKIYATFVDCSAEKALAVLAADNRTSDNAGYDDAALMELLGQLDSVGLLFEAGFEHGDLDDLRAALEETADAAPPTFLDDGEVSGDRAARTLDQQHQDYVGNGVRSVVIMLSDDAYVHLVERLDKMMAHFETSTYSDTVAELAMRYCKDNGL
jgi:ParB family chromosome partitioning protein